MKETDYPFFGQAGKCIYDETKVVIKNNGYQKVKP
jgi:hypothetical protein